MNARLLKAAIFDWGDTLMRDFPAYSGPMWEWPRVETCIGAEAALEAVPSDVLCCAASNAGDSDADLMGRALERAGLRSFFDHLWTSRELKRQKPDPGFFREISRRLGVSPECCLSIGNDYTKDIAPARAAGMQTVWVTPEKSGIDPTGADFRIRSLLELPEILIKINHPAS